MPNLMNIQARLLDTPLMVEPSYLKAIISAVQQRINVRSLRDVDGETLSEEELALEAQMYRAGNPSRENRPYQVKNGTAIIQVAGSLVNKSGYLRPYSGMTGYDGIRANLQIAKEDEDVDNKAVLVLDSGGGEVSGCFDLCDHIHSLVQSGMEITALVDDRACSACYAIASACSKILISETSTVGSIGVVTGHVSREKQLEDAGVKVTLITAGDHKADGNPYQDLPQEVFDRIQANITSIYDMFTTRVANFRNMSVESVIETQALTYMGSKAVEIGLADEVVSVSQYLENLSLSGDSNSTVNLESNMADENTPAVDPKAVVADERKRMKAITASEHAEGREQLAQHLAYDTDMTVEAAENVLKASPKAQTVTEQPAEQASEQGADFNKAMASHSAEEAGSDEINAEEDKPTNGLDSTLKALGM